VNESEPHNDGPLSRLRPRVRKCSPTDSASTDRCCKCRSSAKTTCANKSCACVIANKPCTSCLNRGNCENKFNEKAPAPVAPECPSPPLCHRNRDPKPVGIFESPNERLKLPPAHDKAKWAAIDRELSTSLASVFTREAFNSLSTTVLADKLSSTIYDTLLCSAGPVTK